MSFRKETLLLMRDIRQFVFHLPSNKAERNARLIIIGIFGISLTTIAVALVSR